MRATDARSSRRRAAAAVAAACALALAGACVAAPVSASATTLPDGRAWELVSPPDKHGAPLEPLTEEGGLIQSAAGGGAFAYVALGSVTGRPAGVRVPDFSQLVATRGAEGWTTQDVTTPHEEVSILLAGFPSEYQQFAEDLSAGVVEPIGATPLSEQTTERTPYRRELTGGCAKPVEAAPSPCYVPLVTAGNVLAGTQFGGKELKPGSGLWGEGVEFRTATPDLSHIVLESPDVLTAGFAPGFKSAGKPNLYELASGQLRLVSVLPNEQPAAEAGLAAGVGLSGLNMRGALSSDGDRLVFEAGHLYLRDIALGQTVQLDEVQPGAAGPSTPGAEFQAASSDGSKVFFTDRARLTVDATSQSAEPDLYMCEVSVDGTGHLACALTDLSVDPNPGEAANVQPVTLTPAIDAAGEHVYFVANGVLTTTPNAQGEHAVPGVCKSAGEATCNLYEYDTRAHRIGLVAVLSSRDDADWAGRTNQHGLGNLTARSSPDGRWFTFMSQRSLTGYDNRDARSGQRDEEVFLFDSASGALRCVSCNPSGARPEGVFDSGAYPGLLVDHPQSWDGRWLAGSIPGWTLQAQAGVAPHQSRYLSNDGRIFFDSPDALVPQDTNGVEDVYEYEPSGVGDCSAASATYSASSGGCVALVSSGVSLEESAFLDASESGDEVFFLTSARLVKGDVDAALDVYDAHVCSAASPCPAPPSSAPVCEGDSCQSPSEPPNDQTPASLTYAGPGNLAPPPAKPSVKPPSRAQLLAKALKACRKKRSKKQRLTCEKQARRKYGAKRASVTKRAKGASGGGRR